MTEFEIGHIFYLVLLLLFIGGGVFYRRRESLGKSAQQALIWVGIFAMIIIGYGFRDTLTAELFVGQPRQVDETTIALDRQPNGSFETVVIVNDVAVDVIIDTGATDFVLSRMDAERVGLQPDRLDFSGIATTANGTVSTAPVRLQTVRFADFIDRDIPARVNGGALDVSLLGMSYLDRFERIEIRGDRMLLSRP